MIEAAINRVRGAIEMAKRVGAWEIVEELGPLEEAFTRRKCRMDMELNGMTGYCLPGCCNNWDDCHKENSFDKDGETLKAADGVNRNWFGGTGIQPTG